MKRLRFTLHCEIELDPGVVLDPEVAEHTLGAIQCVVGMALNDRASDACCAIQNGDISGDPVPHFSLIVAESEQALDELREELDIEAAERAKGES